MRLASTAQRYFVDQDTNTATWEDPRFSWSLDANAPRYKRDLCQKLTYFRSQPGMRAQPGNCQIKVRGAYIFGDSYSEIMRQTPSNLKRRLTFGEDELDLDFGGQARFVPKSRFYLVAFTFL